MNITSQLHMVLYFRNKYVYNIANAFEPSC